MTESALFTQLSKKHISNLHTDFMRNDVKVFSVQRPLKPLQNPAKQDTLSAPRVAGDVENVVTTASEVEKMFLKPLASVFVACTSSAQSVRGQYIGDTVTRGQPLSNRSDV